MKSLLQVVAKILIVPALLLLLASPYLGLLFGGVSAVMMILAWGFGYGFAYGYLSGAVYVYAVFAFFSFLFFVTFHHQNCCVGLQNFRSHLKHEGWRGIGSSALEGLAWPWTWFTLHQFQKGWGMSFADAVLHAFEFWFVSGSRELEMTSVDMQTGEVKTAHLKTPEDACAALKDVIVKGMKGDEKT